MEQKCILINEISESSGKWYAKLFVLEKTDITTTYKTTLQRILFADSEVKLVQLF